MDIIDSVIEYQRKAAMHYASARSCVHEGTLTKLKIAVWHQQHAHRYSYFVQLGMEEIERAETRRNDAYIPPEVVAYFEGKSVSLIDYNPAITTVRYELVEAPGSCVSFHCGHLLGVLP